MPACESPRLIEFRQEIDDAGFAFMRGVVLKSQRSSIGDNLLTRWRVHW
jgi:hypothetical protein